MSTTSLLGAALACLGIGALWLSLERFQPSAPAAAPTAAGHCVLVIEGDRDRLDITHCQRKPDPWAGVPQGLQSDYELAILGLDGTQLARVPLDLSKFLLDPAAKGKPARSVGCIVLDPRVAMLANIPDFGAAAANYELLRAGQRIGGLDGEALRRLAEGGR
jgi:hypothetical protein